MEPNHKTLRNRLAATVAAALCIALAACGDSAPSAICSPELDMGTACSPAEDSFIHEAFAGRTSPEAAAELMEDIRFGGSLACAEKPQDSMICAMNTDGSVVVYPLSMPGNRKVEFADGALSAAVTLDLSEGQPVGVRYEGAPLTVTVLTERDGDFVEYYAMNSIEVVVPDAPTMENPDEAEADDAGADESGDEAEDEGDE